LMMVKTGNADAFVGGITRSYPKIIRPALQIIGIRDDVRTVAGFYLLMFRDRTMLLADTTVNVEPSAEYLADIAINSAKAARFFKITPKVALLSYSNFGSVRNPDLDRISKALKIIKEREPELMVEGEMQGHLAVNAALRQRHYPFSELEDEANVLVFPNLHAANTSYRLLSELAECEIMGPVLLGMDKPVSILSQEAHVEDVVNMTAVAVLECGEGTL